MAEIKQTKPGIVVELPVTEKTAEQLIAEAEKLKADLAEKKASEQKKISEMRDAIQKAKAKRAKYEGDDQDSIDVREFMQTSRPELWKDIQTLPERLEAELNEFIESSLTDGERAVRKEWRELQAEKTALETKIASFTEKIKVEYPDFFGQTKTKAPKTDGATTTRSVSTEEVKPFTGVMLDKDAATAKVKELVASGITGETDIIKAMYPGDYTITGSKPRFQVHAIRIALGLVASKS